MRTSTPCSPEATFAGIGSLTRLLEQPWLDWGTKGVCVYLLLRMRTISLMHSVIVNQTEHGQISHISL